LLTKTT